MGINPNNANTLIWQEEDVNSTVQDVFDTPFHVQKIILNNYVPLDASAYVVAVAIP